MVKHGAQRVLSLLVLVGVGCQAGESPMIGAGSSGGSGQSGQTTGASEADASGGTASTDAATGGGSTGDGVDENIGVLELRLDDFSPPTNTTWYGCEAWTFNIDRPIHIVGFRPKVTDPHVHHYVVEMFDSAVEADPSSPCLTPPFSNMVWGWAPGGEELMLPADVGMRAGDSGVLSFRVQVHYNNPLGDTYTDNGGFDVLYTDQLRPHEAAILTTGAIQGGQIPPGDPAYERVVSCPNPLTGSEPVNLIGYWLHAHEIGKTLWGELHRADGSTVEVGREDPYDFDAQTFKPLDVTVNPGDSLETHCIYDASDRAAPTQFGEATLDEMCINFLMYWPAGAMHAVCY